MKKLIITILASLSAFTLSFSQDTITRKTHDNIQAKILEVTPTEIKYKRFDNLDGPVFTMPKTEVAMVRYENGTEDIFNEERDSESIAPSRITNDDLFKQGQVDAFRYYNGYKGAGTGTLITSLISPLVGLVPAIACSSTKPKEINLNYPNGDLIKKPDYYNGYSQRAKKIKQGKVWKNWGIAFGVNIALVIILSSGQ